VAIGPDYNIYTLANNLGKGAVIRFDGSNGTFIDEFVPFFSSDLTVPLRLLFGPDGNLYVSSLPILNTGGFGRGRILRYDGITGAFLDTFVASGSSGLDWPVDMVFGPDGDLYVGNYDPNGGAPFAILRYKGTTGEFVSAWTPGGGLSRQGSSMTFGPDDNLYLSSFRTDSVLRYDGTTGAFIDAFVPAQTGGLHGPYELEFGADGRLYVIAKGGVWRFDGTTGAFEDVFLAAGDLAGGLAFTPPGPKLHITVIPPNLQISWPTILNNFVLETHTTLTNIEWVAVTNLPTVIGTNNVITNSATGLMEYFRLWRP